MVDLELVPAGAASPVHALDRVDRDSVAGLRKGAIVRVEYPLSDPRAARIEGATRTYPGKALTYLLELTFGLAALAMLVVWPAIALLDRIGHRFRNVVVPAYLPPGDARRKRLEEYLRRGPR